MSKVFIRRADYSYDLVKPVIFEILDAAIGERIEKNSRVVIKPNLLAPASPEKAITTHPLIVKAAAEYVIDKGVRPEISDSPAISSFAKILKVSGIGDAVEGMDVELKEFTDSSIIDIGKPFGNIEISEDAVSADILINLPKLKTHAQMYLTLGVKNLFGCITGMKKPEWHLRAGVDREKFASLLVRIYKALKPAVTILDGILAMEGEGPGSGGRPREIGVIMGSSDTVAVDMTVCRMLGIDPDNLLTNRIAIDQGLAPEDIAVVGEVPEVSGYDFPEIRPVVFGPEKFHGFIRRHLVQRPVCDDLACKLCGECWKYCPAVAIEPRNKKLNFDYEKCIRCYCCIEVCPHGALTARDTLTGKITRKVFKI